VLRCWRCWIQSQATLTIRTSRPCAPRRSGHGAGDTDSDARRGAIASTEEWRWRAYGHLTHSARTGEPGFPLAHGCGLWEYLAREPDAAAMFNESMSRVAAANAAAVVRTYDFSRVMTDGQQVILAAEISIAAPDFRQQAPMLDTTPDELREQGWPKCPRWCWPTPANSAWPRSTC